MKKLSLTVLSIFIYLISYSQITSTVIKDSIIDNKPVYMNNKAGSCASPDGAMNSTVINPPSYAWLQANGYCNPNTYAQFLTVCWTFVSTSSSVSINSGFSYNCNNVAFANFNLYDNTCTLIGSGLNFTGLTPGLTYTWCMDGFTWGGPWCTGFTDFCPYYFNNVVLPISLEDFDGYNKSNINHVYWVTASEINNDYFTLERSRGAEFWEEIATIPGGGNLNTPSLYEFNDNSYINGVNYYRLTQTDFDGKSETFNIIAINTNTKVNYVNYIIINLLGQEVSLDYSGIRIIIYDDGSRLLIPVGIRNPKISK